MVYLCMQERPLCTRCGIYPRKKGRYHKVSGNWSYGLLCKTCWYRDRYDVQPDQYRPPKKRNKASKDMYRRHVKLVCEWCSFEAVHSIQMDIDHIDNNHHNNDPSNLRSLCPPCHRLRTLAEMILAMLNRTYPSP